MENENIFGIIPLGGNATRMNNLPKFLLPCNIGFTLLDNTINTYQNNNINNIVSGLSETNDYIVKNNNKMEKIVVNTKTMSETVYQIMQYIDDKYNYENYKNILIMPDTFFKIKDEIANMKEMLHTYDIVVLVWKIKDYQIGKVGQCKIINNKLVDVIDKDANCNYEYFWGSIGWNSNMNKHITPNWETIGDLLKKAIELKIEIFTIICNSNYYDCGTFSEYFTMIKNET
jgi:hypothetical protein